MKDLLFQPINLILLSIFGFFYAVVVISYTRKQAIARPLGILYAYATFYLVLKVYPVAYWHPYMIALIDSKFSSILIRLIAYAGLSLPFLPWFRNFGINTLLLLGDPFLSLILLQGLLSGFWSTTPIPTFRASLVVLGISCFGAHFAKKYSWPELFKLFRVSLLILAICSTFVSLSNPSVGKDGGGWCGVLSSSKALAIVMSLGTAVWFMQATFDRKKALIPLVISFLCFLVVDQAGSKTGLATFFGLAGVSLMLSFVRSFSFKPALALTVILFAVNIAGTILIIENAEAIVTSMGKDMTLTGRTPIWKILREEMIPKRPFFGYGYGGFWQGSRGLDSPAINVVAKNGFRPNHAHSGYYEMTLHLGLVGMSLYFLSTVRNLILAVFCMTNSQEKEAVMPIILMTFLAVSNFSETEVYGMIGPHYQNFYYCIMSCRLTLDTAKIMKQQKKKT